MSVFPKTIYPLTLCGNKMVLLPTTSQMGNPSTSLASWIDFSGRKNNATEGTGANQPSVGIYQSGAVAATFDGTTDRLGVADNTAMNIPLTIIVACIPTSVASGYLIARDSGGAPTGTIYMDISSNNVNMQIRNADTTVQTCSTAISAGSLSVVIAKIANGSPMTVSINGGAESSSAGNVNFSATTGTIGIGYRVSSASNFYNGKLLGVQLINRIITSDEQANLIRYFQNL